MEKILSEETTSSMTPESCWRIGGKQVQSRFMLGTALYPSPHLMLEALKASQADIITVSIRRQSPQDKGGQAFWEMVQSLNKTLLPNTAGCRTVKEAVNTAMMARELFDTNWIKLEVIGDDYTLQPDPFLLVEAAEVLVKEGFEVFPYTTEDLIVCQRLVNVGCRILMPWAAPIGTAKGPVNPDSLIAIRKRFPDLNLIIDAGIGLPSHATQVMEMGFDGVLLNSAVALSQDPVKMAQAFAKSIEAGRLAYEAVPMPKRDMASPSTPVLGTPFWHLST
jgi:thiazole synthase